VPQSAIETTYSQERLDKVVTELLHSLHNNPVICETRVKDECYKGRMGERNPCLKLSHDEFQAVFKICLYSVKLLHIHLPYGFKDEGVKTNGDITRAAKKALLTFSEAAHELNESEFLCIEFMMTETSSREQRGEYFFFRHLRVDLPLKCTQQAQQLVQLIVADTSPTTKQWIDMAVDHAEKIWNVIGVY